MSDQRVDATKTHDPADSPSRAHLRVLRPNVKDGALRHTALGAFDLEMGGHLTDVTVAWRSWGRLNASGDNAVLVLHALTGDANAAGDGGWWEPVIGPGKPIDTDHAFVVCANVLGGCQGTTGPATVRPDTGRPWAMHFPLVTIGDMVRVQRRLMESLGVTATVAIGGSIGGFQALEWATRHADLVRGTAVIAASGALGAQGIALHGEVGRRAIMADPAWHGGDYASHGTSPENGLAIARMAAMVTYHSRDSLGTRFGRNPASRPALFAGFGPTFDVEGYLHYHGRALVQRFDANSYLYLTRAMDLYDVARDGGEEHWLRRIAAPVLFVGISSDWLFPAADVAAIAASVRRLGGPVVHREIDSPNGHDSFLKDWDQLNGIVGPFLAGLPAGPPAGPPEGDP